MTATIATREGPPIEIVTRGAVAERDRLRFERALARLVARSPRPIVFAGGALALERNPSLARPAVAKASFNLGGRVVRAHVAASSVSEAVDLLADRLRHSLREVAERDAASHREPGLAEPGEWRHGFPPSPRPAYRILPVGERQIVRRKTFASEPMTDEQAIWEMRLLDHDFFLYTNADTGEESVVYLRPDGTPALAQVTPASGGPFSVDPVPAPVMLIDGAVERLNLTGEPFLFFVDAQTRRGNVVYRRYDGHYGVLIPAVQE